MNDDTLRQWLIECFGPVQGEEAWRQFEQLPFELREHIMSQDPARLPKPGDVHAMMRAFTAGGLNNPYEMKETLEEGPINSKLAKSIALQKANGDNGNVNAEVADAARRSLSKANLWLDITCNINPAPGTPEVLSRSAWVEGTLDSWIKFANPVARAINDALSEVIAERFGDIDNAEVTGLFAGAVPIPLPSDMNNPVQLMKLLANTSFAMQLGEAAGALSHEVHGSFDQGISLLKNPAGGLIPYNCIAYAKSWGLDNGEVMDYLALREVAHARLFASVPWLMTRFESLIIKYANATSIDLNAVEDQLRDAQSMDPSSFSGAVNLSKVAKGEDSEIQQQALHSLETLLALTEGWVDCVTWRAGVAHIPHIEQLREMMRRERAAGGPSEVTFESLLGLHLRPRRMREATKIWEDITNKDGIESRDAMWGHPDLLPALPENSVSAQLSNNNSSSKTLSTEDFSTEVFDSGILDSETTDSETTDSETSTNSDEVAESSENKSQETEKTEKIEESNSAQKISKTDDVKCSETGKEAKSETDKSQEKINIEDIDMSTINWDDELSKLLEDDAAQKQNDTENGSENDTENGTEPDNKSDNKPDNSSDSDDKTDGTKEND